MGARKFHKSWRHGRPLGFLSHAFDERNRRRKRKGGFLRPQKGVTGYEVAAHDQMWARGRASPHK